MQDHRQKQSDYLLVHCLHLHFAVHDIPTDLQLQRLDVHPLFLHWHDFNEPLPYDVPWRRAPTTVVLQDGPFRTPSGTSPSQGTTNEVNIANEFLKKGRVGVWWTAVVFRMAGLIDKVRREI